MVIKIRLIFLSCRKLKLIIMKRIALALSATLFFVSACNDASETKTTDATGDTSKMTVKTDEPKSGDASPITVDSATMMKKMMDYGAPGPVHEMIAKSNGTWNGEVTMWMDPKAPPMKSMATSVNKMIMGGRYQQSNTSGNMMGMPFEGMGTLAYDNTKKVLVSTWIDNMGTGIMKLEGPWDEATKTATMSGRCTDPVRGEDVNIRETFKMIDDNNQLMEMYGPGPDGKEMKMMEIKFTRKK